MTAAKPGSLAEALAMLQADLPRVTKDQSAKIEKRDGSGGYSYKYADLTDVSDAILPRMAALGLSFAACPNLDDQGRFTLDYCLMHVSDGRDLHGSYPLPNGGSPQEIGKAITYARRYALCAVTGLAPGGDDDDAAEAERGHHARASAQTPAQQRASRGAPPPKPGAERKNAIAHERLAASTRDTGGVMAPGPIPDEENLWQAPAEFETAPGSIMDGQRRTIEFLLTKWQVGPDRDDRHAAIMALIDVPDLGSMSDLSAAEAARAIRAIQDEMAKERAGA
jgi:ERF superfamily protein